MTKSLACTWHDMPVAHVLYVYDYNGPVPGAKVFVGLYPHSTVVDETHLLNTVTNAKGWVFLPYQVNEGKEVTIHVRTLEHLAFEMITHFGCEGREMAVHLQRDLHY